MCRWLRRRFARRRSADARGITRSYLEALNDAYNRPFFDYADAPLLVVNTNDTDPIGPHGELDALLQRIDEHAGGTVIYSPQRGPGETG